MSMNAESQAGTASILGHALGHQKNHKPKRDDPENLFALATEKLPVY